MNNVVVRNKKQITIGLDLGDRRHTYCVLDEAGKVAREGMIFLRKRGLGFWFSVKVNSLVAGLKALR